MPVRSLTPHDDMVWFRPMSTASTSVCSFRLDPAGHVQATMVEGAHFGEAEAREAVAVMWRMMNETRRPVLVDMRGIRSETREAREYFTSEDVAARVSSVAILIGSPVSKMVANFFLRLGNHRVPTRLFTSEDEARAWLREQSE